MITMIPTCLPFFKRMEMNCYLTHHRGCHIGKRGNHGTVQLFKSHKTSYRSRYLILCGSGGGK